MKIKKYIGYTTREAMEKMKMDLGLDAIILSTRTIKQKGLLGFFKRSLVEITAAYDDKKQVSLNKKEEGLNKINNELKALKNMINDISSNIKGSNLQIDPNLMEYWTRLVENGVDDAIATSILKKLSQQINLNFKDSLSIRNIVKKILIEYLGKPAPLDLKGQEQKVVFFIGPTGVGKTTTLAKIAAQMIMKKNWDIGLITSDTYRIAAVEQLKVYSEILNIPLEVIYNEEDMFRALVQLKEKHLIFVDTTGRSHKDLDEKDEIFNIINSIKNKEIYLVLSSTTDYATLKSIVEKYKFIHNYKIIFTKIDEAEKLGNILNVRYLTNKPIAYLTTGQDVPDDIEVMNTDKIVELLLGEI